MNELAVSIAVILFPGLIATVICDHTAVHSPRWRTFKYAVYSFIFGVLCYIVVQFLFWGWAYVVSMATCNPLPTLQPLHVWSLATKQQSNVDLSEVLAATIVAPFMAAIATAISTYKVLTKVAAKIKISNKFGDENLFSYYLTTKEVAWVYVRDPSVNQTYKGRVWGYSETDHIQELVLAEVDVYSYDKSDFVYSLPSLYLARAIGSFVIEAVPDDKEEIKRDAENSPENSS